MPFLFQLQFSIGIFFWLLGCLALGTGYAFLLYHANRNLSATLRKLLFVFRALVIALIAFLLFAPLIKFTSPTLEKPLIILAQDNSLSIGVSKPEGFDPAGYEKRFRALERQLAKDYEVRSFSFGQAVSSGLKFDHNDRVTNIASLYEGVQDRYSGRNIGAVVLASDGIYNRGGNPQFGSSSLKAPVYTIALGDTIPKKDILISNVNYNNIAYLGNRFQIEVGVDAFQSRGVSGRLTVKDHSGTVFSEVVPVNSNEFRRTIPVTLSAKAKGIQKYTIAVSPVAGELSRENNTQTIYVEVIDGRQNVLILANAPHPDITAIKQSVEENENYEVRSVLAGEVAPADISKADLVILHQVPSSVNAAAAVLQQIANKPALFVLGAQSNTSAFSASQPVLSITGAGAVQEATANISSDFQAFTLSEATATRLNNMAPLLVPFGNYGVKGPVSVLMTQQIGRVATSMPLLTFSAQGQRKTGVLAGEGIWRWRLEDFSENGNHDAVNELLTKTVQYLSVRDDKRKFRVYTAKNTFDENERVVLNAELYNDSYELVNTPDVKVNLKNSAGKRYSYIFTRTRNSYILDAGILPPGEYSYAASADLGGKNHTAEGRFVISQLQAELQQTTANHQLLYSLAQQSGGRMLYPDQLDRLTGLLRSNETIKTVSYENRRYEELIDLKWLFFLILALLTVEWFLRKRNGEV
ncbi:MAG TPA: hypothetical protein VGE26_03450 [Sphingobacteriaceae bacterium]